MKRKTAAIITLIIICLAASGCAAAAQSAAPSDNADKTAEQGPEDDKGNGSEDPGTEDDWVSLSENDDDWVSLNKDGDDDHEGKSYEELAAAVEDNVSDDVRKRVERKLNSIEYYGFLHGLYSDPCNILWDEVFYVGAGFDKGYPSAEVVNAYLKETGEEEIYTDLTTISGRDVRQYVKATTGHDYSEMNNPLTFVYLKDHDLFISEHGDTNQTSVELSALHKEGNVYIATYDVSDETRCVSFSDEGGTYRFIYNLPRWFVIDPTNGGDVDQTAITDGMIIPDSDMRRLTQEDLEGLSTQELRIARNEIYARHGRKFADKELQEHFEKMEWYFPTFEPSEFDEKLLNDYEIYNLGLISEYEKTMMK